MPAPVTAEHLETRNRERLARAETLLRQLETTEAPFTKDSVIRTLNDLQVEIHNLAAECGIYVAMHPDREVQQLAEKLQREAAELGQRQLQSLAVYDALGAIDVNSLGLYQRGQLLDIEIPALPFGKIQIADGPKRHAHQQLQPLAGRFDKGVDSQIAGDIVRRGDAGLGEKHDCQTW